MNRSWSAEKTFVRDLLSAWQSDAIDPPEESLPTIIQHLYVTPSGCDETATEEDFAAWYETAESFAYRQYRRFLDLSLVSPSAGEDGCDVFTHDGQTYDLANYRIALAWKDLAHHFLSASEREPENTAFWELLAYKGVSLRNYVAD